MTIRTFLPLASFIALFLIFTSCSSTPKVPPQVFTLRNEAAKMIELGSKAMREGNTDTAQRLYTEAYRIYTSVDEAEGRIRALDGLGRISEGGHAQWDIAQRIAQEANNEVLVALASLLQAEAALDSQNQEAWVNAQETAESAATILNDKPLDKARALRIAGSASKALGAYDRALKAYNEAAALDLKNNFFTEYATDQYLIASIYSKQGEYDAAIEALWEAVKNDKRVENSSGIGDDYVALGMVAEKAGALTEAENYYTRSIEVYKAARLIDRAKEAELLLEALQ